MLNNRLVCNCILVLRLISKGDKHVGLIVEETGLYKNFVFDAVKTLQKAQLVKEIKTPSHKQKKIQQLTEFGVEVVKFILFIEEINRSYSKLKNALIDNFSMSEDLDEIQIKNKLRSRGWSSKEIEFYPEFARYASLLTTESLSMIYDVFIHRYFFLLLEYEIKRDAKIILNKMVVDALEYHMSTTGDILTKRMSYCMKDNSDKRNHILLDKLLSSIKVVEEHNPYLNRFTDKQGFDLLISICSMLEIPKKTIQDYISKFNSTLEFFGKDWMQGGVDPYFINGIMVKDSYKETRRQSQRMLSILNEMLKRSA